METWPIDGDLQAYKSVPDEPRAVVVLLHGYGEHAGRHRATARAFARRGIALYSYDQRGHGRSPGRRAYVGRFADLVSESLAIRDRVRRLHPGLPLVLMGASMGGVVALRGAQADSRGLAGVVLVAPALSIDAGTPAIVRRLGALLARVAPATPVAKLDLGGLARDGAVGAAYAIDPLTHHGGVPARTAAELIAAGAAALAAAPTWRLPTFIVHGEADRIASADGPRRFAAQAGAAEVTLRLVPDGRHEPFNEPGGDGLIEETASWILERRMPADLPDCEEPPSAEADEGLGNASFRRRYSGWEGLAFAAAVNGLARLLGTNTGRYQTLRRPWFAPPGWVFPIAWGINSALSIWGNLRVLNAPPSADRTAYLRLWAATWFLYISFGYAFFRRKSPVLGLLVTTNFSALALLSAGRAVRIERRLWLSYATLLPWLGLATAVAAAVALENPDPLLDPSASEAAGRDE